MKAKKGIGILVLTALIFCFAGTALCETTEPDYYSIGLKVTGTMGEMIDSEAFLSLFGSMDAFSSERDEMNTHDYDRPLAVYAVRYHPESVLEMLFMSDPENGKVFQSLSPALQDQIRRRFGLKSLASIANGRAGSHYLALCSIATASIWDDSLTGDEEFGYLYIFERGKPILVSFGYHAASGTFVLIPEESRKSPEAIASYLAFPGVEIVPVH